jgi:hypothetical protein
MRGLELLDDVIEHAEQRLRVGVVPPGERHLGGTREPPLLHAASTVAAAAATATPRTTRFLCMLFFISPRGSGRRPFPKVLGRLSMVPSS